MRRVSFALGLVLLGAVACARPVAPLPDLPPASPTPAPALSLPQDAGPHDALTEWWYYTGHLRSDRDGHLYGFEFTIFQARRLGAPTGYLAHFAISDVDGQRFSHQARFSQGEAASGFPLDVNGWRLGADGPFDDIEAVMQPGPGADPPFGLHLRLIDQKPAALHHGGYIDYGPPGGSYYYSRTRLSVTGTLETAAGTPDSVAGEAWMDHQWGNFVVGGGGGWDWYSLQLDDRTELMLYVLRSSDGQTTGVYGTQVLADGSVRDLGPDSVHTESTGQWTSPHTGATYPSGWLLTLPDGQRITLTPQLLDQELYFPAANGGQTPDGATNPNAASDRNETDPANTRTLGAMAYWEGAVTISGDQTGQGYVELTGYAHP
jgi:predicted secreted hydrolase